MRIVLEEEGAIGWNFLDKFVMVFKFIAEKVVEGNCPPVVVKGLPIAPHI